MEQQKQCFCYKYV